MPGSAEKKIIPHSQRRQLLLFILVGIFNTAMGYGFYAMFLFAGLEYWAANLASLLLSIPIGFKAQGTLVFQNRSNRLILKYIVFWAFLYWLNITFIGLLIKQGLNAYQAGAIALFPTTAISFLMQKYFVFRRRS